MKIKTKTKMWVMIAIGIVWMLFGFLIEPGRFMTPWMIVVAVGGWVISKMPDKLYGFTVGSKKMNTKILGISSVYLLGSLLVLVGCWMGYSSFGELNFGQVLVRLYIIMAVPAMWFYVKDNFFDVG